MTGCGVARGFSTDRRAGNRARLPPYLVHAWWGQGRGTQRVIRLKASKVTWAPILEVLILITRPWGCLTISITVDLV